MPSLTYASLDTRSIPCPLCGGGDFLPLASHDRYRMGVPTQACKGCGLILTNPAPTPAALERFYREQYRAVYRRVAAPDTRYVRKYELDRRAAYAADVLERTGLLGAHSRILDFGCAEGSLLREIRARRPEAELRGIEPGTAFAAFARAYAVAPVYASLDEALASEAARFDAIVAIHVVEHLLDPAGLLRQLASCLAPAGTLYVDVPDATEYRSLADLHLAHLLHFTPRTLHLLCERAGLVVAALEKHQPPRHPPSLRAFLRREGPTRAAPAEDPEVFQRLERIDRGHARYHLLNTRPLQWARGAWRRVRRLVRR